MPPKLAIIAGSGALPGLLVQACLRAGRRFLVIALEGYADPAAVKDAPHRWYRLGAAGAIIDHLKGQGVEELVFAGGVPRPSFRQWAPDWRTLRFIVGRAVWRMGDGNLLNAMIDTLERDEGFRVVGPESVAPELLVSPGPVGAAAPDPAAERDIETGWREAMALGAADRGQAVVVRGGRVIEREDNSGTDALLRRCACASAPRAGVLVKTARPIQDRRVDLPAIGMQTVESAAAAGLAGIAVEAGGALIVDRAAVTAAADKAGLFVTGIARPRESDAATAPLIYLLAGEPSGDNLGGRIMQALKARAGVELRFAGVGGERMIAEGLDSLVPLSDLSVWGMAEILPHVPRLYRLIHRLAGDIRAHRPAILLTIDNPAFNFAVAARARIPGAALVHLNAPKVWAYRPGRVHRVARLYDHLLCLLPFEPPYFHRAGMPASFIGHPIVESGAGQGDGARFRAAHGIPADAALLCVLPGSRAGEVKRLLPVFGRAIERIAGKTPGLRVVVPTIAAMEAQVRAGTAAWEPAPMIVLGDDAKFAAFAASNAALAASGTVSLELALARLPAVIAYRMSALSAVIVRRLKRVPYITISNLVLDKPVVPELTQENCTPEKLAEAVLTLLRDRKAREEQVRLSAEAMRLLGQGGPAPSLRAADILLDIAGIARSPART